MHGGLNPALSVREWGRKSLCRARGVCHGRRMTAKRVFYTGRVQGVGFRGERGSYFLDVGGTQSVDASQITFHGSSE